MLLKATKDKITNKWLPFTTYTVFISYIAQENSSYIKASRHNAYIIMSTHCHIFYAFTIVSFQPFLATKNEPNRNHKENCFSKYNMVFAFPQKRHYLHHTISLLDGVRREYSSSCTLSCCGVKNGSVPGFSSSSS